MKLKKLMLFLVVFFILTFFIGKAFGQIPENRGVSWIGQMCSAKSDCSVIDSAYKNASVINAGWLYLTFNPNGCKCSPMLLDDPRPKRIRVDVCNSTCFPERGRHCEAWECFAGMTGATASKAVISNDKATYARIDKAIGMIDKDFSGASGGPVEKSVKSCLECTLTHDARVKLNEYVKSKLSPKYPDMKFVDNPINDKCLPGYICEKHGSPKGAANQISDNDGTSYDGIDQYGYWTSNEVSYMALAWKGCNNGLKYGEGYKPGPDRTNWCGASRDGKDFSSATQQGSIDEPAPVADIDKQGCKKFFDSQDGKGNFVLKLGDGRSYGVWLAPTNAKSNGKSTGTNLSGAVFKSVQILKNGKVIDAAKKQPGFRYGDVYLEDPKGNQRRIYDFRGHPATYPDNSVLNADGNCFIMKKPKFRID